MKLSRVSRIVRILTALQAGHGYSADELAELTGVNRRTVFRDLKELKSIGVPYKFQSTSGGYRIDPEYFLPSVDLNLQEALSLLLLIQKCRGHLPVPFRRAAWLGGLKIENNLPGEIQKYCDSTLRDIYFRFIVIFIKILFELRSVTTLKITPITLMLKR